MIGRIVAIRLKNHLARYILANPLQSAYRSGHSTETALLKIKNDIHVNLAQGCVIALVLLDLSVAFDTIDNILY